jgi:hypothetical protein
MFTVPSIEPFVGSISNVPLKWIIPLRPTGTSAVVPKRTATAAGLGEPFL